MNEPFDQLTLAELVGGFKPNELTLVQALEFFERLYMASRNLAERTRVEYKNDLKQAIDFLEKQGVAKPAEVSLAHLQAFQAEMDTKGFAGVTRRRKTSSIKAFFGFLAQVELLANDPTKQLIMPEREYKEPRYLTSKEYRALLRACSHQPRDAAIIELILQTGLRLSEVARLTVDDIELPSRINRDPNNMGEIFIKGKGRKQRTLPLNYKAARALKAWLAVRPDIEDPALFVSKFRKSLGQRAIQRVVGKYLKEAGVKNASVHTLRHSFGTHQMIKGTNPRTVQHMMGHADLQSTSLYIHLAKEEVKRELQEHAL